MSKTDLFVATPEQRNGILKSYNRDEDSLAEDVATLRGWLKQQPHLPEVACDDMIERFHINNKCSIEKAKNSLDMYYTVRSLIPEFYENINPKLPQMKAFANAVYLFTLPKLTKDLDRIHISKFGEEFDHLTHFEGYQLFAHVINMSEIRQHEDCFLSTIIVFDLKDSKIGNFTKITPMHMKKAGTILEKVYSNRIRAIHLLNCPGFVNTFVSLAKTILKPKLAARIYVHKNDKTMLDLFPREIVPKDYGGDEMSLVELRDIWNKKLEEYKDRFDLLDTLRVNEELRPKKLENDELLGFHGNFKSLRVD